MRTKNIFTTTFLLLGLFSIALFNSCKEDEPIPDPIASFQYAISEDDWTEVTFTNYSQHAESYSWNFGDEGTSTEESPVHVYAEAGSYTVTLTATNKDDVSVEYSETITVTDPYEAVRLLVGESSKDWRLLRDGITMGIGPGLNEETGEYDYTTWWTLENDGKRPCVFKQTWTFSEDGTMTFDDGGVMWGEGGVFPEGINETCFEATPENMVNVDGVDVSAWLGGTHNFEYNPSAGKLTLTGEGAWIGLIKVTPDGDVSVPQQSVTYDIQITEETLYDLMAISVIGDGWYWQFNYVSYHDWSNEPAVVEEAEEFGEDLEDVTPTELYNTFETAESYEYIGDIGGTSILTVGQDDPAGGATKVGKYERIASMYQEAQLRVSPDPKDIQFDNFSTAKVDIYIPEGTVFADGGLVKHIVFGFADMSQTEEWWNSPTQFVVEGDDVIVGEWTTYSFDLTDVKARTDLDMIFLGIGGGGHNATGIFYVRDLTFE
jgi:PKD repeat protein